MGIEGDRAKAQAARRAVGKNDPVNHFYRTITIYFLQRHNPYDRELIVSAISYDEILIFSVIDIDLAVDFIR